MTHCATGAFTLVQMVSQNYLPGESCTILFCLLACLLIVTGIISFMRLCKTDDNLFSFQNRGQYLKNSQRFGALLSTPSMVIALVVLAILCVQLIQVI